MRHEIAGTKTAANDALEIILGCRAFRQFIFHQKRQLLQTLPVPRHERAAQHAPPWVSTIRCPDYSSGAVNLRPDGAFGRQPALIRLTVPLIY